MTHIGTRDQLLDWLAGELKRLNRRSLIRAMEEGQVELLGGFNTNPPGWAVRVVSPSGGSWTVLVTPNARGGSVRILRAVPWHLWIGGGSRLYQGDNPIRYTYLKHFKERLNAKNNH